MVHAKAEGNASAYPRTLWAMPKLKAFQGVKVLYASGAWPLRQFPPSREHSPSQESIPFIESDALNPERPQAIGRPFRQWSG